MPAQAQHNNCCGAADVGDIEICSLRFVRSGVESAQRAGSCPRCDTTIEAVSGAVVEQMYTNSIGGSRFSIYVKDGKIMRLPPPVSEAVFKRLAIETEYEGYQAENISASLTESLNLRVVVLEPG